MSNKVRIILWGGSYNSLCKGLDWINEGNVEIVAIADNDNSKKLMGKGLGELYITPDEIKMIDYDYIMISSSFTKDIIKQLDNMGIDIKKIIIPPKGWYNMDRILRDYSKMHNILDIYNKTLKWKYIGENSYSIQWMANRSQIIHKYYNEKDNCFEFEKIRIPYQAYEAFPSAVIIETFDILSNYIKESEYCDTSEGPYEYKEVQLEEGDTVIDCGANVGMFSSLAAYRTNGGKVYAFEPVPQLISILNRAKDFYPSISIEEFAVSDKCGTEYFEVEEQNYSESHITEKNQNSKSVISVNVITLDRFVLNNNIKKIDFIKADIEGSEPNMLLGAKEILKKHAPKLSICTYHNPNHPLLLESIIKNANPNYIVEHRWKKLFAYVPD